MNNRNFTTSNILALGPESEGNFAIYSQQSTVNSQQSQRTTRKIQYSRLFGDLLDDENFAEYRKELEKVLRNFKPDVIVRDLHPLYRTSKLADELEKKLAAGTGRDLSVLKVQHHASHAFSYFADQLMCERPVVPTRSFVCIACDGTGYKSDEKIWGGEVLEFKLTKSGFSARKIGGLEEQLLIGGDLAIKKPSRVLLSILLKSGRDPWSFLEHYYSRQEFDVLKKQYEQGFNCVKTSSTGRVLDAVALLLGFADDERKTKHDAANQLSTINYQLSTTTPRLEPKIENGVLSTSHLFKWLIDNIGKDRKDLAIAAQAYLIEGLYEIAKDKKMPIIASGGMMNNAVFDTFLSHKKVLLHRKIPRGDGGLALGQLMAVLANSGNELAVGDLDTLKTIEPGVKPDTLSFFGSPDYASLTIEPL